MAAYLKYVVFQNRQELQKLLFQILFSPIAYQVFYFLVYGQTYSKTLQLGCNQENSAVVQSELSSTAYCPDAYIIASGRYFIYTAAMCFINKSILTF